MAYTQLSAEKMRLLAMTIRERGLVDLVLPLLDVLQVWGFVGGQVLWMVTPFFGERTLAPIAEAIEQPEMIQQFRQYLFEGETQ